MAAAYDGIVGPEQSNSINAM